MEIIEILDADKKSKLTEKILRSLPSWFGIESAIIEYVNDVQKMDFLAAEFEGKIVGFIAINRHFENSAEIHVMGILKEFHRKGIGRQLVLASEKKLRAKQVSFYQVKTLSPAHPDKGYAETRKFYKALGFVPIEEFKTLWGEANPALMMMKYLG